MSSPQEQLSDLTHRTQESFKSLWQQWSEKSSELMKGMTSRTHTTPPAGGNPEEVLDAVFDFAEHLIAQQRIFAKQMLAAATKGQQHAARATDIPAPPPSPAAGGVSAVPSDQPGEGAAGRGTAGRPTPP
jgi:hypothetical protein